MTGVLWRYSLTTPCVTTANWVANGSPTCNNCVSQVQEIDNNPCSPTNTTTRWTNSGNACNTTPTWTATTNTHLYELPKRNTRTK